MISRHFSQYRGIITLAGETGLISSVHGEALLR